MKINNNQSQGVRIQALLLLISCLLSFTALTQGQEVEGAGAAAAADKEADPETGKEKFEKKSSKGKKDKKDKHKKSSHERSRDRRRDKEQDKVTADKLELLKEKEEKEKSELSPKAKEVQKMHYYFAKIDDFLEDLDRIETKNVVDADTEISLNLVSNDFLANEKKYKKLARKYDKYFPAEVFSTVVAELKKAKDGELSWLDFRQNVGRSLQMLDIHKWGPLQMIKSKSKGIKVNVLRNKNQLLYHLITKKNIFENYYKNLGIKYKVRVLRTAIKAIKSVDEDNIDKPDEINSRILSKIFQASGPILQKLLQRINDALGDVGATPFIKNTLKEVLKDINPLSDDEATRIIRQYLPRIPPAPFRDVSKLKVGKRLGAASIGQAHIVHMGPGAEQRYVIKFVKPEVAEFAAYERGFLNDLIRGDTVSDRLLRKNINTIADIIDSELDLSKEEQNLKRGIKSYNLGNIVAVGQPAEFKSTQIMAMDLADGKDVDRTYNELTSAKSNVDLLDYYQVFSKLYFHYNNNALLNDGNGHGDPHKGNMFYDKKNKKIILIDWGNSFSLSKEQQEAIIKLLEGLDNSSDIDQPKVMEGIKALLNIKGDAGEDKEYEEIVTDIVNNCIFHDTDDKQLMALVQKWKNEKRTTYRLHQDIIDSVLSVCLSPFSNSNNTRIKLSKTDDAGAKLKTILDLLNSVMLDVPQGVQSYIYGKCMLEAQFTDMNNDLASKSIDRTFIQEPKDVFRKAVYGEKSKAPTVTILSSESEVDFDDDSDSSGSSAEESAVSDDDKSFVDDGEKSSFYRQADKAKNDSAKDKEKHKEKHKDEDEDEDEDEE